MTTSQKRITIAGVIIFIAATGTFIFFSTQSLQPTSVTADTGGAEARRTDDLLGLNSRDLARRTTAWTILDTALADIGPSYPPLKGGDQVLSPELLERTRTHFYALPVNDRISILRRGLSDHEEAIVLSALAVLVQETNRLGGEGAKFARHFDLQIQELRSRESPAVRQQLRFLSNASSGAMGSNPTVGREHD